MPISMVVKCPRPGWRPGRARAHDEDERVPRPGRAIERARRRSTRSTRSRKYRFRDFRSDDSRRVLPRLGGKLGQAQLDIPSRNANVGERHHARDAADRPADAQLRRVGQELEHAKATNTQPRQPVSRGQLAHSALQARQIQLNVTTIDAKPHVTSRFAIDYSKSHAHHHAAGRQPANLRPAGHRGRGGGQTSARASRAPRLPARSTASSSTRRTSSSATPGFASSRRRIPRASRSSATRRRTCSRRPCSRSTRTRRSRSAR